jgi:hypothetical protein
MILSVFVRIARKSVIRPVGREPALVSVIFDEQEAHIRAMKGSCGTLGREVLRRVVRAFLLRVF